MAINTLITKTTAAATSNPFTSAGKNNIGLCCNTLQGSETVTLQVYDWANATWSNAQANSTLFQITPATNFMTIYEDAQTYRVVKSATTNSVGVDTVSDIQFINI